MSSNIIYTYGEAARITVPAAQSIAISTKDRATVSANVGFPNYPEREQVVQKLNNEQAVFGPFTSDALITIDTGAAGALYQIGTDPVIFENYAGRIQPDPAEFNVTGTLDPSDILSGIVTTTAVAAVTATLPTGTIMDASSQWSINDSFDWTVINTSGANALTLMAGSDHIIIGIAVVAADSSAQFRTRKIAENDFITYRITP